MGNTKTVVADAVQLAVAGVDAVEVPVWSENNVSLIAGGAELICDGQGDIAKGLEQIKDAYVSMHKAGGLTYDNWEDGRKRYEAAYILRGKDSVDPTNAANTSWHEKVVPLLKAYGLNKPSHPGKDAKRKAEKREQDKVKALEVAKGRSIEELKEEQLAMYKTGTPEKIAEAKALDKSIEVLEKDAKKESEGRLSVLKKGLRDLVADVCKSDNETLIADAIVAIKQVMPVKQ
jgi:hypothetical protein